MADIELVIKIPKEQYNTIKSDLYNTFPAEMKEWGLEAIRNGTPLPEGAEILTKDVYSDLCTRAADVPDFESEEYVKDRIENYNKLLKSGVFDCVKESPSVEPERKRGIWTHEDEGVWICGVCGEKVGEMGDEYGVPQYNFCPYCGADMTGRR